MSISDRLDKIEQRAEAATEGPWEYRFLSPYKGGNVYEPSGFPLPGCTNCGDNEATYEEYDAEFIAHARTDVPALVAALRSVLDLCDKALAVKVSGSTEGDAAMAAFASATLSAITAALGEDS